MTDAPDRRRNGRARAGSGPEPGSESGAATETGDPETMADVRHTHPRTGEAFGTVYRRGPAVADGRGGERDADDAAAERVMKDVDHTSPADDANEVWERGPDAPAADDADRDDADAETKPETEDAVDR